MGNSFEGSLNSISKMMVDNKQNSMKEYPSDKIEHKEKSEEEDDRNVQSDP